MSTSETWYDRQATISKLLTYASILLLLVSLISAVTIATYYRAVLHELYTVVVVSTLAIGGTFISAFLVGLSAIIDLMIVHAEALHDLKGK